MARPARLRQPVQTAKERREEKSQPVANTKDGPSSHTSNQGTQQELPVVYAIESKLASCFEQDERVDDTVVYSVLRSIFLADPPSEMPHAWMYLELQSRRRAMAEISNELWNKCIRTVMRSVRTLSPLRPGAINYLINLIIAIRSTE